MPPLADLAAQRPAPAYRGPAWIDGAWLAAECREHPDGYDLTVAGGGRIWVDATGAIRAQLPASRPDMSGVLAQGPGRILALALRGVFCLHASAAVRDGVVAFAASSGAGKSTLAELLRREGWPRWADDIVPVRIDPEAGALATRDYPQSSGIEDSRAESAARDVDGLPLRAVCFLKDADGGAIELRAQRGVSAAALVVRHTVAACLFGPRLLARHLAFCTALAETTPILSLRYPRRMDIAPRVVEALRGV
jgi:hypothetical protein